MPVCKGCGGSYDDKFKFCPYCGRATPESDSLKVKIEVASSDRFEICQIERQYIDSKYSPLLDFSSYRFYADAIGINGEYTAGETPIFLERSNGYNGEGAAHSFLIKQLSKDGWKAIALSGGEWWQTRFQRRIGENYPKPWSVWQIDTHPLYGSKYHFVLFRTKKKGKKPEVVVHAKSDEYELPNLPIFISNAKRVGIRAEAENGILRNLEKFSEKMVNDGFESVESAINEKLKKCVSENTEFYRFYRTFLKREQL